MTSEKMEDDAETSRHAPLYALISGVLRKAIRTGSVASGAVILEGPVAELLRCTRTPVRQALLELEHEGLIHRFDGRGYMVGPSNSKIRRVKITAAMIGISSEAELVRKTLGWEAIYEEVERDVLHLSIFGRYRVNELELARYFNVGRMVARDVLLRLERLGLLEKDERLRWAVIPLDGDRINHLYELRWLLEPTALRGAANAVPVSEVQAKMGDLQAAMDAYPKVDRMTLDKLEDDLHVSLLSRCPNKELLQMLERTRCILTLSKHVLGASAPMPKKDPFMSEHFEVMEAIAQGNTRQAEALLQHHLEVSCIKVTHRAELVRNTYEIPLLPYIN